MSASAPASTHSVTVSQQLIWAGTRLSPDSPLYNMPIRADFDEALDPKRFAAALEALVAEADSLRTVFSDAGGAVEATVLEQGAHEHQLVDLSSTADPESALDRWIEARIRRAFDLGRASFDSALLRLGEDRWTWFFNQHHITTDAWSAGLILRRVGARYDRLGGAGEPLPPLPAYREHVARERAGVADALAEASVEYWREKQRQAPRPPEPYGRSSSATSGASTRIRIPLGAGRAERLVALADTEGVRLLSRDLTRFSLFATAICAYLARVSGQRAVTLGAPSHNRRTPADRETIGLFVELFPLTAQLDEGASFRTLYGAVSTEAGGLLMHGRPGLSTPGTVRLFNVVLNYINVALGDFGSRKARVDWLDSGAIDPAHALRFHIHDFAATGEPELLVDINDEWFDASLSMNLPQHFLRVLDAMLDDFDTVVDAVPLALEDDASILPVTGRPGREVTAEATVLSLFDAQADRAPEAVALECEGRTVSYGELQARSRLTSRLLTSRGVAPGDLVGVCTRRSPELVVSVLGVLRTGAAYVPLEPRLPKQRLRRILGESGAELVVVDEAGGDAIRAAIDGAGATAGATVSVLSPAAASSDEGLAEPDGLPEAPERDVGDTGTVSRDAAAYVLYTSGSTGVPKGVVVEHGGLADYVLWAHRTFAGEGPASFPLHTAFGFDLTVTSLFVPLVSGGTLVIYPEPMDGVDLSVLDVFSDDAVDVVKLTPSHLSLVLDRAVPPRRIRALMLGGEDFRTDLAKRARTVLGERVALFNEYGPTEAIVGCMHHRFDPKRDRGASVPIGVAAEGMGLYLLDDGLNPVPRGVEGELFIAGDRLARGYLGQDELTAERFLADPRRPGGRMYRSGDRARWDGRVLHYLGRADDQVKIRGTRIELAEVEAAIAAIAGVRACTVGVAPSASARTAVAGDERHCTRCGISSRYPGTTFDDAGVCNICREFEAYRETASAYFEPMAALEGHLARAAERRTGKYDCIMLLSGGKDSTYALFQLAKITPRILTITLDNGYISDGAKDNIRRAVEALDIEHRFVSTPAMNDIFVDSLKRHSNVCNGCFKVIYTMAVQTALDEGIPAIVTGLSRGQFFETRLTPELFLDGTIDTASIDRTVLEARKAYHKVDDAVSDHFDVSALRRDETWEKVEFLDFYRYCDVELDEVYRFLAENAPWVRPGDTGRSTNCLINELGIYYHTHKEGFHNYSLPYSWDVRLGHKQRNAAMEELDDRIDPRDVQRLGDEIGLDEAVLEQQEGARLAAWFVADGTVHAADLRERLGEVLTDAMIPTYFVEIDELPLTPNGKVDRAALPDPRVARSEDAPGFRAPRTGIERLFGELWARVLGVSPIGLDDNFYQLGGDSIAAIQIVARARDRGLQVEVADLFEHQTVATLAAHVGSRDAPAAADPEPQEAPARFGLAGLDQAGLDQVARLLGANRGDDPEQ